MHYTVDIPADQPPGLDWYHTHPHGESYQQDLDGMSGAIVIDGIEQYVPELRRMTERVLILLKHEDKGMMAKVFVPRGSHESSGQFITREGS
jgi:hypothetical protein